MSTVGQDNTPHIATADDLACVNTIVKQSKSSFYWAMRFLPAKKRNAMFAIYAFCRQIDDIADEPAPLDEKYAGLDLWRKDLDALYNGQTPAQPVARALAAPVADYALDKAEFIALIDGMAMDLPSGMQAPSTADMILYCRRVAGAVGRLSVPVFGCNDTRAKKFALDLGQALQLTNILRDQAEDAQMGRLYLSKEILQEHGIESTDPNTVMAHPAIGKVRKDIAKIAQDNYQNAEAALQADKNFAKTMKPAVIMKNVYSTLLDRMFETGFEQITPRPRLSGRQKLVIALKTNFGLAIK